MKRLLLVFCSVISLLLQSEVFAQSSQQVQVLEYNGKEKKTPLKGVSLSVQNAASTMSDEHGMINLQFRTLKAGDAIQVRRIDLAGYEVFNQEAVDAWTISTKQVFTLVLCKSERIKTLCEQYNAVASESYARQLKNDKDILKRLKNERKINQQEYEQRLSELEDQYNAQLDNLENYVDRFAHIDLSELSDEEQKIIELVQQGEIDKAIGLYEEMDLLSKYQNQSKDLNSVRSTISELDSLSQQKTESKEQLIRILQQQIELYEQQGEQAKADSLRQVIGQSN